MGVKRHAHAQTVGHKPRRSRLRGLSFRTLTEPLEPRLLLTRLAVIGDFSSDVQTQPTVDVSNLVKSWSPDAVLTTGDNNYPNGAASTIDANIGQYYHDFIYPYTGSYGKGALTNRFYPSLGNHDWGDGYISPATVQPYTDYFSLPGNERYYHLAWGPVEFFMVTLAGAVP